MKLCLSVGVRESGLDPVSSEPSAEFDSPESFEVAVCATGRAFVTKAGAKLDVFNDEGAATGGSDDSIPMSGIVVNAALLVFANQGE